MAISNTRPAASYSCRGKTVFPFNIVEQEVTDSGTGKKHTQYEYDEARVTGEVTREKLIMAGIAARYSIEEELATINNYLEDKVKYGPEYAEYQAVRQSAKATATTIISAKAMNGDQLEVGRPRRNL